MLKVKLITRNRVLCIDKYELTYPFLSVNTDKILWNLNSFEFKEIKGNFRLFYSRKIDFSGFHTDGEVKNINNLKITNHLKNHIKLDSSKNRAGNVALFDQFPTTQYLLFMKHVLFYINEKNISSALNSDKKISLIFYY